MHGFNKIICTLLTITTLTSGFPISPHTDLKQVGTIKLKCGTVYKVLKLVEHRVEDNFADATMRRDTKKNPTNKVYIDENGLRHFWSDFSDAKSLYRKANEHVSAEDPNDDSEKTEIDPVKTNTEDNKETETASNEEDNNEAEVPESSTVGTTEPVIRTKPKLRKKSIKKSKAEPVALQKPAIRVGKERTVVHTTFFCPFFGVIKMSRFIN